MTTGVVTVGKQASFKTIVRLLEERRISAVPVIDDHGVVVGVVSEADLLVKQRDPHGRGSFAPGVRRRAELRKAQAVTAAELMSKPPVTVPPGTSVVAAARLAARAGVKRLPVVDDAGRPVGIVTRGDLLKVFLRPDEDIRRDVLEVVQPVVRAHPLTLDVTVADGVVRLRGQVRRHSAIAVLTRMAEIVDGVVEVERELDWDIDDTLPPPVLLGHH